jgi:hypothetical protein
MEHDIHLAATGARWATDWRVALSCPIPMPLFSIMTDDGLDVVPVDFGCAALFTKQAAADQFAGHHEDLQVWPLRTVDSALRFIRDLPKWNCWCVIIDPVGDSSEFWRRIRINKVLNVLQSGAFNFVW